eukprot:GHRR01014999.1.p1 GENE.GHRR01014999.1~~GHRR01014999.1.p1  ORF type:complete len:277 (+),score=108.16 GHRR01014999.1:238-1068(+)
MAYNAVELNAFSLNDLTSRAKIVQRQRRDPGAGEVEVQIKYAGVNPSDIFSVNGDYPGFTKQLPAVPGFDGMGVVTKLGPSVIDFQEGQRVTSLGWLGNKGNGSWQQYVTLPQELLVALPDNISDEAGAQFFINPVTVVGLLEVANVAAGDWVLITAAGSTLSRMLIAAARAQGIKTIGTVRRADAVDEVKSSTGCDEVVVTSTQNLVEQVHAITGGRGAASVLDSIGGDLSEALAGAVRDGGTIWLYGVMGGPTFTGSGIATLFRCVGRPAAAVK